jgi:hypothetical protein
MIPLYDAKNNNFISGQTLRSGGGMVRLKLNTQY